MSLCYQVGVSWYGKERENLMWLGKGAITLIYVKNLKTTYSGVVFVVTENLSLYQPEGAPGRESDWLERAPGLERRCRPERDGDHCSTAIIVL